MDNPKYTECVTPCQPRGQSGEFTHEMAFGLSKLEYFSGLAMQSFIVHHGVKNDYSFSEKRCAEESVEMAKAMLDALSEADNANK